MSYCLPLCIHLLVCPSLCLCVSPTVCLCVYPALCLCVSPTVCLCVYPALCLCVSPTVCLSVDCRRGQSLVVHAINEGRQAARQIDIDLMGHTSLASSGGVVTSTRTAEDLWSRPVHYDIDTA